MGIFLLGQLLCDVSHRPAVAGHQLMRFAGRGVETPQVLAVLVAGHFSLSQSLGPLFDLDVETLDAETWVTATSEERIGGSREIRCSLPPVAENADGQIAKMLGKLLLTTRRARSVWLVTSTRLSVARQ